MRHLEPRVRRLNDLLRRELGAAPNGQGIHQWRFTGDLVSLYVLQDAQGRPVIDYRPTDGGVLVEGYKTFKSLQRPDKPSNWAICTWEDPGSKEEWEETFRTVEDYPGAESYLAANDLLILDDGFVPTLKITQAFIDQIRRVRKISFSERVEKEDAVQAADSKAVRDKADGIIDPDIPLFNVIPGKRGGSVSFGGTEKKKEPVSVSTENSAA